MHISQITDARVQNVADFLKIGDVVKVKVLEVDRQGRVRLSIKEANAPTEAAAAPAAVAVEEPAAE